MPSAAGVSPVAAGVQVRVLRALVTSTSKELAEAQDGHIVTLCTKAAATCVEGAVGRSVATPRRAPRGDAHRRVRLRDSVQVRPIGHPAFLLPEERRWLPHVRVVAA
mmetsp:Transcript_18095/g.55393  ORF Transcript_18095/g.55393 Transcript_18095/m.55393 type:complete len:107 (+) Transcript_18095:220-540(+)